MIKKTSFPDSKPLSDEYPPVHVQIKEEKFDDFELMKEEDLDDTLSKKLKIPNRERSKKKMKAKKPRPCDICGALLSSANTLRA